FPLDFLGIGITRRLAMRAKTDISLKTGLSIFILDTLAKTVVFPLLALIAIYPIFYLFKTLAPTIDVNIFDYLLRMYWLLVPCLILCSAWVWLYFIGLNLVRRAVFLFDVNKHPIRSIGIAVLFGCYGFYAAREPSLWRLDPTMFSEPADVANF